MDLYIVRNKQGKFFRTIGYGGSGNSWRDTIEEAKIYTKFGQAKSRVTFFFNNYPEYGCPEILHFKLNVADMEVIDMEELTKKNIQKGERAKIRQEIRSIECRIKNAQDKKENCQREYEKLLKRQNALKNLK